MKYKKLSKEQLIISFDRLTRFKNTKDKYFRVFSDIIISNLIEPVYKKTELEKLNPAIISDIVTEIVNSSLESILQKRYKEFYINKILKDYENSVFFNDNYTQSLLDNKIDYVSFLNLIDESCPINLRWLKAMSNQEDLDTLRRKTGLKFPIKKVLLVEGITEEILLPTFSKYLGYDFYREGIQIIPAGGKNQVVKLYYKMSEELKIPIFLLLDKDAEDNIKQIKPKLRGIDKIHLVSCGEFEDLLPKSLIVKTINNELSNFATITNADLDENISAVKNLENIFKTKGVHEFRKADFAKLVKDNIVNDSDISEEIISIIEEISGNSSLKKSVQK